MKRTFNAETFCVLALMLLFLSISLLLVALGTNVYKTVVRSMNDNYEFRTSLSYVATKIRQGDEAGKLAFRPLNGINALVMEEEHDGIVYQTWIYHYNKGLYEMFAEKNTPFQPQDGMRIMDVESFEIKPVAPKLLSLTAKDDKGKSLELMVAIKTE